MPRVLDEKTVSLYYNKTSGQTFKVDVPHPKATLTSADVKAQMDAIVAIGDLFDIASIKDAGVTARTVSDFAVES
jgi:hypothetical protein